jgi:hypothetical protein
LIKLHKKNDTRASFLDTYKDKEYDRFLKVFHRLMPKIINICSLLKSGLNGLKNISKRIPPYFNICSKHEKPLNPTEALFRGF